MLVCVCVKKLVHLRMALAKKVNLPAELDTERDIILYQVYHFAAIGKIDPEVTTSASSAPFERCIRIVFKVDALHSTLVQKSFFDVVFQLHWNRNRLDMRMSTFGTQPADFEKDWDVSVLCVIGTKCGFVSEKKMDPTLSLPKI